MTTVGSSPHILHADQEHSGLRTAVFISLFVAFALIYLLLRSLLPQLLPIDLDDYAPFLSCLGALPLALAFVWGVELLLKRYWHSGLSLALDETGLYVEDRRSRANQLTGEAAAAGGQPAFRWSEPIRFTNWYFRLSGYTRGGRERRVPPKWYCLASELQQDENRLVVFTFMPPPRAEAMIGQQGTAAFHVISPAELQPGTIRGRFAPPSRPTIPTQLLHSKEGRYWLAERRRWEEGVELTAEDFQTLHLYARAHQTDEVEEDVSPSL